MQTELSDKKSLFHLISSDKSIGIRGNVLPPGRFLVGRAESCDVIITSSVVSAVHAVLEVGPNGMKIYDMNSKNGTFVNGEKIIAADLNFGSEVKLGNLKFELKKYVEQPELPPILDILEPAKGAASIVRGPGKSQKEEAPFIVYPLGIDKNSDFSEYIFEDSEDLLPIFKYEHNTQAIEIIILHEDSVYSVDYLTEKNGTYQIVGSNAKKNEVEFAYLGRKDKVPFIEMSSGNCVVFELHNYTLTHLEDKKIVSAKDGRVNLQGTDIVKLKYGGIEIYIRKVSSPPKVKLPPFFRRDQNLKKYIVLMLLFVLIPWAAFNFYEVDEELKKEKDPERIATILYKQKITVSKNKQVEKTPKKKPQKQKSKKKKVVKKQKKKPRKPAPPVKSVAKKKPTTDPGKKAAPKKQVVKKVKKPSVKRKIKAPGKTKSASRRRIRVAKTRFSNVKTANKGTVDVYKSFDYKSTVSALIAKGGSLRGAKTATSTSSDISSSTAIGGGVATNLKKADIGSEVGSLTGATVGKLGQSKGTEGLSAKTGIYTAGIPSETVVLGSMDPDVIRRILREHIPNFRYCYQKELNKGSSKNVSGTIGLSFTIGASGHVSRAGLYGSSRLPGHVKRCVVRTLKGIQFPRPLGRGTVDVKQPFNFQPKSL